MLTNNVKHHHHHHTVTSGKSLSSQDMQNSIIIKSPSPTITLQC